MAQGVAVYDEMQFSVNAFDKQMYFIKHSANVKSGNTPTILGATLKVYKQPIHMTKRRGLFNCQMQGHLCKIQMEGKMYNVQVSTGQLHKIHKEKLIQRYM